MTQAESWCGWPEPHAPHVEGHGRCAGSSPAGEGCYICRPDDPHTDEEGCAGCHAKFASLVAVLSQAHPGVTHPAPVVAAVPADPNKED